MIQINKLEVSEKEKNILVILNEILKSSEISTSEIAKSTGLSYPTISRVLRILKARKMIFKTGEEETSIGRRPEKVSFNNHYGYMMHLVIRENGITGYLSDLRGQIIQKNGRKYNSEIKLDALLENVAALYHSLVSRGRKKDIKPLAVSVSIPGVVNSKERTVTRLPSVFGFREANLFDEIEQLLKVPVIVNNSSMLMAMGQYVGGNTGADDLVFINSDDSFGIGAGIVIGGKLLKGADNLAGEIGHIYYSPDNFEETPSNSIGMLEKAAGLRSLYAQITTLFQAGRTKVLNELIDNCQDINIETIEKAAMLGDVEVKTILDGILKIWAIAVINIYLTINPQLIVLGGAVTPANIYILNKLEELVAGALFFKPHIILNQLGDDAQVIGGMHLLMEYVYNSIILKEAIKEKNSAVSGGNAAKKQK